MFISCDPRVVSVRASKILICFIICASCLYQMCLVHLLRRLVTVLMSNSVPNSSKFLYHMKSQNTYFFTMRGPVFVEARQHCEELNDIVIALAHYTFDRSRKLTSRKKSPISPPRKSKKSNVTIDLLSLGIYAPGTLFLLPDPKFCWQFESALRSRFRSRSGELRGSAF